MVKKGSQIGDIGNCWRCKKPCETWSTFDDMPECDKCTEEMNKQRLKEMEKEKKKKEDVQAFI